MIIGQNHLQGHWGNRANAQIDLDSQYVSSHFEDAPFKRKISHEEINSCFRSQRKVSERSHYVAVTKRVGRHRLMH